MIMTSDNLMRDLRDIDRLIVALSAPNSDEEDLEDLRWLRARRKFLSALAEVRRAQRGKKVVSLEVWCHGWRAAGLVDSSFS